MSRQETEYWRSLEELKGEGGPEEFAAREFPEGAAEWNDPVSRREFLRLTAASVALAGVGGCVRQPVEKIYPYVRQPEEMIPGKPLYFATAVTLGGIAEGLLVESHEGRPTKIDGNPDHPASLGATTALAQASLLTLYDPDRAQVVIRRGSVSTWDAFVSEMRTLLANEQPRRGAGLRILTQTITSPTLAQQIRSLLKALPEARWHQFQPVGRDNVRAGARLAFGEYVTTRYRLDQADVILALGADFLFCTPGSLRYTHDFAARRGLRGAQTKMNRLYVVESTLTTTAAKADHRLMLRPREIEPFTRRLAAALGVAGMGESESAPAEHADWIAALAEDLQQHTQASVVIAGDEQPPSVHALAHAINGALGNVGRTV
ncbi:MAG TPA: TAT-variant-translocated molybdopterin oxidoreductase, partial [Phycisphaerae bacterium]